MMESGPGRRHHRLGAGRQARWAIANVISFDMGGTTAKASLVRGGEPTMAAGYYVGGYASGHPVMVPVIDVVEVGAGGGSIAWIDEVGALKVGPQSAGADPGPICYRGGGTEPTITDANRRAGPPRPRRFPRRRDEARREGAARAASGRRSPSRSKLERDRGGAGDRRYRASPRCRSRCARCRSRRATTRATSRWSPRAARGRCTSLAIARELHIPTVIVPLLPGAFLGARHAARPTSATISSAPIYADLGTASISRSSPHVHAEMVGGGRARLLQKRNERRATRFISTCAMSARNSRFRFR